MDNVASLRLSEILADLSRQKRQVSKVLLDGFYDPDSPLSMLLGVHMQVVGEMIWQVGKSTLDRHWTVAVAFYGLLTHLGTTN